MIVVKIWNERMSPLYCDSIFCEVDSEFYMEDENDRKNSGCEITAPMEKEDFLFKTNERSSFVLKLTCDENFNYKL